jgi:peptidoglycan/xylan/chitin deacetylase (PgdA/CDA1 family)
MKKLSILSQWLVVAALLGFVGYVLWRPTPRPDYAPETWRNWDGVTVLSYAGIARRESPGYPSVKRLEAQLSALQAAGYRTVHPEDVQAFLEGLAPLPEKALLLIFEGGRKEAFIRATPVLQRTGFSAVMAVPTTVMNQWGGFYVKRRDVARVSRLPQWQIGSMGHRAIERLPDDGPAEAGRFLAQRIRHPGEAESSDAFRDRIAADYAQSAQLLEKATGRPPILYLYPFAEAGQHPGADPLAEAANRDAVTRHFGLAFVGGSNPFNGPGSDPWTLTRLRVPGDWTPEQLVRELAASQPRHRAQDGVGQAASWIVEREGRVRDSTLQLSSGALAWLRGTDAWADVDVRADMTVDAGGSAALYARYTGPRSWLRVTVNSEELRLQERLGDRLLTLHRRPAAAAPQTVRLLRLRVRNNRAWVWLDDGPVAENVPVSPESRRGRVGLGSDGGALRVAGFAARPLPSRWVIAHSIRRVSEEERDQVQAILPTWFRTTDHEPAVAQTAQQDLLQTAVAGIRTLPVLTGGAALDADRAHAWASAIDAEIIRADVKMLVPTLAVEGPAFTLAADLRNLGYRVAHVLSPAEALRDGRAIAQVTPDEVIVVNGRGTQAEEALAGLLREVPPSRLALREVDGSTFAPDVATVLRVDSGTFEPTREGR